MMMIQANGQSIQCQNDRTCRRRRRWWKRSIRLFHSNNNNNKNNAKPYNKTHHHEQPFISLGMKQLCRRLLAGEQEELRLGCCESIFSKRDYQALVVVLKQQQEQHELLLQKVALGHEMPRQILLDILEILSNSSSCTITTLTHLTLNMDGYPIPFEVLQSIVSMSSLKTLEFRTVTTTRPAMKKNKCGWLLGRGQQEQDSQSVVSILPYVSPNLEHLRIMACADDWTGDDLMQLSKWTQTRQRQQPLAELSLAYSTIHARNISTCDFETFLSTVHCHSLDLTCCGLQQEHTTILARAIPQNPTLKQLILCGNVGLMTTTISSNNNATTTTTFAEQDHDHDKRLLQPWDRLARACVEHLQHLDIGYCQLSHDQRIHILNLLVVDNNDGNKTTAPPPPPRLKSLKMWGQPPRAKTNNNNNNNNNNTEQQQEQEQQNNHIVMEMGPLLEQILRTNPTLQSLQCYYPSKSNNNSNMDDTTTSITTRTTTTMHPNNTNTSSVNILDNTVTGKHPYAGHGRQLRYNDDNNNNNNDDGAHDSDLDHNNDNHQGNTTLDDYLERGLAHNYTMKDLQLGSRPCRRCRRRGGGGHEIGVKNDQTNNNNTALDDDDDHHHYHHHIPNNTHSPLVEFYLTLNRAGRGCFRHPELSLCDWANILAKSSTRPDVLYWFLTHGSVGQFLLPCSCGGAATGCVSKDLN